MDKYEYRLRAEEINALIDKKQFAEAVKIADSIDWRRVKSVTMLCKVSELYKISRRYEDSRDILLLAYDRQPGSRKIVYSLCELSIKLEELVPALEYYKEFVQIAPRDTGRFILQYRLYEAQDVSLEERIAVLEEYKKRDYREKWAYELAYLYHRIGLATRCVEECDELILWFGEGKYVIKAMELKMLHAPLTQSQQEKYDRRFDEKPAEIDLPVESGYEDGEKEEAVETEVSEEIPAERSREKLSVTTDTIPDMPIQIRSVDVSSAPTQRISPKKEKAVRDREEQIYGEAVSPEESYESTGIIGEDGYGEEVYPEDDRYSDDNGGYPDGEEEGISIDLPEIPVAPVPEDMDIHVKTIDMGRFNTMDLQAELAQNLADLMQQEDMEATDATKAIPVEVIDKAIELREAREKEERAENDIPVIDVDRQENEEPVEDEGVEELTEITESGEIKEEEAPSAEYEREAEPDEVEEIEEIQEIPETEEEPEVIEPEETEEAEEEVGKADEESEAEPESEEEEATEEEAVSEESEPEAEEIEFAQAEEPQDDLNALAEAALAEMKEQEQAVEEAEEESEEEPEEGPEEKSEEEPEAEPEAEPEEEPEEETIETVKTRQWKPIVFDAPENRTETDNEEADEVSNEDEDDLRMTQEDVDEVNKVIGAREHTTITEEDLLNSLGGSVEETFFEENEEEDEEVEEEAAAEPEYEDAPEPEPERKAPERKELQFIPIGRPRTSLERETDTEEPETEEAEKTEEAAPVIRSGSENAGRINDAGIYGEITHEQKSADNDNLTEAEKENLSEQITGQLTFQDIMAGWEQTKKENEEKHIEEMRQQILRQTGPMMADYVKSEGDNLNVISPSLNVFEVKPRPDEKVFTMEDTEEDSRSRKKALMNTAEINGLEEKLISSMNEDTVNISGIENDSRIAQIQEEARESIEETLQLDEFEDIGRPVFESFSFGKKDTAKVSVEESQPEEPQSEESGSALPGDTGIIMASIKEKNEREGAVEEKPVPGSSTEELEKLVLDAIAEDDEEEKEREENAAGGENRPASIYDALRPKDERGSESQEEKPKSIYDALRPKDERGDESSEEKPKSIYDQLRPKEDNEPASKPASIYDALKPKNEQAGKEEASEDVEAEGSESTEDVGKGSLEEKASEKESAVHRMSTAEIRDIMETATSESYRPTSAAEAVAAMKAAQNEQKKKASTQDLVNALGEFDIGNTKPPAEGNTGFIIQDLSGPLEELATEQPVMQRKPPVGSDGKRALSKEEKEMFSDIATTKEIQEQIAKTIDNMSMVPSVGNIRITGEKGTGTLDAAKSFIKIISANKPGFSGKVAKISGDLLNSKGVADTLKTVEGGALIIDEAGSMNDMTVYALNDYINNPASPEVLIIMEDTKKDMDLLFSNPAAPKRAFDLEVDIETLDNNGLVSFGKEYANEREFSIDEMGTLALYTRISEMQTSDHTVTVDEVREIIDEAIKRSEKRNVGHFMDVILSKRYDTNDMVVLREKDFLK